MTSADAFDRYLATELRQRAPTSAPAGLFERVLAETERVPQRRAWRVPDHWLSPMARVRLHAAFRTAVVIALVALIIVAFVVGLVIGARHRPAPPFGPAANGLIAYVSGQRLYVADADGTDVRALTEPGDMVYAPTWSPDGTRLAFWVADPAADADSPRAALVVTDARGEDRRTIAVQQFYATFVPAARIAWAPDSVRLAYAVDGAEGTSHIYLARADAFGSALAGGSSSGRDVGHDPVDAEASNPAWSPDGRSIAFEGGISETSRGLYFMDADGTDIRGPVILAPDAAGPPWWDLTGRVSAWCGDEMIFVTPDEPPSDRSCFVFDLAAGVAPDALQSVYIGPGTGPESADSPGPNQLTVYLDDGAGQQSQVTLSSAALNQAPPVWSPDCTKLLAVTLEGDRLVIVGLDGSVRELPLAGGEFHADWQRVAP